MKSYPWPGNVRELRNAIQRSFIIADETLDLPSLPPEVADGSLRRHRNAAELSPGMSIAEAERILIEMTLEAHQGDKPAAAKSLGVSLKTLYNRLNAYSDDGSDASQD